MDLGLDQARVLITGGASNVGRGIVHSFGREGSRILICDVDEAQGQRVVDEAVEIGAGAVDLLVDDLTQPGSGARAVHRILERWGGIDVLVNNVGWSEPGFLTEQTDRALWQRTVEVNLYTAIDCTQAALPPMRDQGAGAITFISSDAAFGAIRQGIYGATKAGVIALARTVAREDGKNGIRSNVICPGLVIPEDRSAVGSESLWARGREEIFNDDQVDYIVGQTPLRRLTAPADIGNAVTWVSSDAAARQVTGQVIAVGGGSTMP